MLNSPGQQAAYQSHRRQPQWVQPLRTGRRMASREGRRRQRERKGRASERSYPICPVQFSGSWSASDAFATHTAHDLAPVGPGSGDTSKVRNEGEGGNGGESTPRCDSEECGDRLRDGKGLGTEDIPSEYPVLVIGKRSGISRDTFMQKGRFFHDEHGNVAGVSNARTQCRLHSKIVLLKRGKQNTRKSEASSFAPRRCAEATSTRCPSRGAGVASNSWKEGTSVCAKVRNLKRLRLVQA